MLEGINHTTWLLSKFLKRVRNNLADASAEKHEKLPVMWLPKSCIWERKSHLYREWATLSFLFYISIQLCLCINWFCLTPAIFSCACVLHMTSGIRKDKTSISDFPHGHSLGFIYSQDEQKQMISGTQFAYLYSPALTTQSHFEHIF